MRSETRDSQLLSRGVPPSHGVDVKPVDDVEADGLFADLAREPALLVAVSGGPDSTALLYLLARWSARQRPSPRIVAVTVDHGLRAGSRAEAAAVKRLAAHLAVPHRTMRWTGDKPSTGVQEKARAARYGLLLAAARREGAHCVVTAHTLDDQAETVLFRLARGSGLSGIAAMARVSPLPSAMRGAGNSHALVRPLLDIPKARLVATLQAAGLRHAVDPSNEDPRFARVRWRRLLPALAQEGLTTRRLVYLARRVRRSETAIETAVCAAFERLGSRAAGHAIAFDAAGWRELPAEIALRLIGRAVGQVGDEGPVELGKLEALYDSLAAAFSTGRFRRTLAGAMVSLQRGRVMVERAPPRRLRSRS
ncbi:MAG: tRNA lysidine(34) synthetase TilS [Xanthobacteraceae bacterium]|nr:tRNA lysidine(34) synthetase TilS [Xanthobacteraceae bacterium]